MMSAKQRIIRFSVYFTAFGYFLLPSGAKRGGPVCDQSLLRSPLIKSESRIDFELICQYVPLSDVTGGSGIYSQVAKGIILRSRRMITNSSRFVEPKRQKYCILKFCTFVSHFQVKLSIEGRYR